MLYYKGKANLNANRVVAIVGTRNITEYGKENCLQLVEDLKAHPKRYVHFSVFGKKEKPVEQEIAK